MKFVILISIVLLHASCTNQHTNTNNAQNQNDTILKLEMHLSAFGVEADDFPSIDAVIDFQSDSSFCSKSFYDPAHKNSTYSLSKQEIKDIHALLTNSDLNKLKNDYKLSKTDQPSSTTVIYTQTTQITINDYGLVADYPLNEIYKLVYKY